MTDIADILRELAAPYPPADRVKCAIQRAARTAGLSYWRTFDLWYGRGVLRATEQRQIHEALVKKQAAEARHELARLRTRLATLKRRVEAVNNNVDQDLDSPAPDLFRWASR